MAHSHVSVGWHDRQEDRTGELIDTSRGHVDLAHEVTEWPIRDGHGDHEEWNANEEALVSDGEVHDVHVGDGLHLTEAEDNVDDKCVAQQSCDADDEVYRLSGEE